MCHIVLLPMILGGLYVPHCPPSYGPGRLYVPHCSLPMVLGGLYAPRCPSTLGRRPVCASLSLYLRREGYYAQRGLAPKERGCTMRRGASS